MATLIAGPFEEYDLPDDILSEAVKKGKGLHTHTAKDSIRQAVIDAGFATHPSKFNAKRSRDTRASQRKFDELVKDISFQISSATMAYLRGRAPGSRSRVVAKKDWLDHVRGSLRRGYYAAFELGFKSSGVSVFNVVPTQQDKSYIEGAVKHELTFFDKLLSQIDAGSYAGKLSVRLGAYTEAMKHMFYAGRIMGTPSGHVIDWLSPMDRHTCKGCAFLYRRSPYTRLTLPTSPRAGDTPCLNRCFVSPKTMVYAEGKGRVYLRDIQVGDRVLTHIGHYKTVEARYQDLPESSMYSGDLVTVTYRAHGKVRRTVVTPDHRFLAGGRWVAASDLTPGDSLSAVCLTCLCCGRSMPIDSRATVCSSSCRAKMYADTSKAREKWNELAESGNPPGLHKHHEDMRHGLVPSSLVAWVKERKGWSDVDRFGADKAHEKSVKLASYRSGKTYEQLSTNPEKWRESIRISHKRSNPERYANLVASGDKHQCRVSKLNKTVVTFLDTIGVAYTQEAYFKCCGVPGVKTRGMFVDFVLDDLKIAIEVDGCFWHSCSVCSLKNPNHMIENDEARDRYLKSLGYTVVRVWEHEVRNGTYRDKINLTLQNHTGRYTDGVFTVISVQRESALERCNRQHTRTEYQLYCLQVEGDESFVIKDGLVSHNCRCRLVVRKATPEEYNDVEKRQLSKAKYREWLVAIKSGRVLP